MITYYWTMINSAHAGAKAAVRAILEQPHGHAWSLQGFGMLRLHMSDNWRLHVWSAEHAVSDVSVMHDHPWDFTSHVLAGRVVNTRFEPAGRGQVYHSQMIKCGEGGCGMSNTANVSLSRMPQEVYGAGESYRQQADEIHRSDPDDGTVTLVHRRPLLDPDHARVFWDYGKSWVSAEPRRATKTEVEAITRLALEGMGHD